MTAQTRSVLYTYFETGDKPTQSQFSDLIDSNLNLATTSAQYITSDVSVGGTFDVSGNFTVLNSALTNLTGNLTVAGAANIYTALVTQNSVPATFNGASTFNGSLTVALSALATFSGNTIFNGTVSAIGNIIPAGGIHGNAAGTNAVSGNVGEFLSIYVTAGAAVTLSAGVDTKIVTLPLPPGDWDVFGKIGYKGDGGTIVTYFEADISTSAVINLNDAELLIPGYGLTPFAYANPTVYPIGLVRVNVSASTNVFLNTNCQFSVSACSSYGRLKARRVQPG